MRADAAWWFGVGCLLLACSREPNLALEPAYCELPPVGTVQQVSTAASGLTAYYKLAQPRPGKFEAIINADFPPGDPIRATADQCLAEAAPFLTGPQGEQLTVRFSRPEELGMSAFRVQIVVTDDPRVRGHLYLWQRGWNCAEMVHEVFHLLGLVDEYPEPTPFACRPIGPPDSLLANPRSAYEKVFQTGSRPSLLYPSQFMAVLYPGCRAKNAVYLECAANAYRRPAMGKQCLSVPAQCSAGGTDWIRL
jgi:hypothetical protein